MKPWRLAGVLTLSAAAAVAFVAVNRSSPMPVVKSGGKAGSTSKLGRDDAEKLKKNMMAMPGPEREGGPLLAAEEDYANRAYPAVDIPFHLTQSATKAWGKVKGNKNKKKAGTWTLVGPSSANFPDVLTFSGAPYTTSGRITALAIDPSCGQGHCYLYVGAAGGGVWRTDKALHTNPSQKWEFISGSFATNAIGTLIIDPTDPSGKTLYAGTGEPNASADSEAGVGIYKSTNGGNSWTLLASAVGPITTTSPGTGSNGTYTGNAFDGRSISAIAVDPTNPNHLYVASSRGVRGISSVSSGGATSNPPTPRPPFGLFESTDGGATFTFIWDGGDGCPGICNGTNAKATIRGVNDVELDPYWNGTTNRSLYAGAFGPTGVVGSGGVWRSTDGGVTWAQIKTALNSTQTTDRAEFAVTKLSDGHTRMYVGVGNGGANAARFYRTDDALTATNASFTDMTTTQNVNYCTGQCWYDNVVYSPPGKPNVVYLGGSFDYGNYGFTNNGRAFIRSTDAGASFTDMTWDATTSPTNPNNCCQPNPIAPNGQHPDSHAIVEVPGTDAAFFGTDGGLVRSSGTFSDISSQCAARGLGGASLTLCQQLLSRVPTRLYTTYNDGLSTLQFQSVSVNPFDASHLMGGTQDNGTFESGTGKNSLVWPQLIYGDGGQSGFNAANGAFRFNSFTGQFNDVNFQNGDPLKWVIATGPIVSSNEASYFYAPIIADPNPAAAGTIFQGSFSIWRTQDWAGDQGFLEANCPEFTTSGANPACGDFEPIGPAGATDLTDTFVNNNYGSDRRGGAVAAIARAPQNTGTIWVATGTGRVFYSANADAAAGSVVWERLDSSSPASPGRFISGIYVDPTNPAHAWISYSGYNFNTPTTPGHVFEVTRTGASTATWTSLEGSGATAFPDFPATGIAYDSMTGDVYASNDFGVMLLANGSSDWVMAGNGLPMVEVAGLTIVPNARKLFAATHGRSAWQLALP